MGGATLTVFPPMFTHNGIEVYILRFTCGLAISLNCDESVAKHPWLMVHVYQ